jgi:hypothetical protein
MTFINANRQEPACGLSYLGSGPHAGSESPPRLDVIRFMLVPSVFMMAMLKPPPNDVVANVK